MKDITYHKKKNLYIKREKFETRLIKYLEKLVDYMDRTGKALPEQVFYDFILFGDENGDTPIGKVGAISGKYSDFADKLFANMRYITDKEIESYDMILDDFHSELDDFEKEFAKYINH